MNEILLLKKDILSKVLTSLRGSWDMAESLLEVLTHTELNEVFIDSLYEIIEKGLTNTKGIIEASKVEQAFWILRKVKEIEKEERLRELSQCDSLQKILEDFTIF